MARVLPLLLLINYALVVVSLIDCLSADDKAIRLLSRRAWVFVILILSGFGALCWFVAGQPAPAVRLADGTVIREPGRRLTRAPKAGPRSRRPFGPEDDPDFIASLSAQVKRDREK